MRFPGIVLLAITVLVTGCSQPPEQVNVYSARKEALIKPLLDQFSADTGITVNLVTAKADALLERLKAEGEHSPADLLITVDAGRLHRAKQAGVLQPLTDSTLEQRIPATLRDPEGFWYGLSVRARVIVYAPERVDAGQLESYESLADEQWRGRICIRSSDNIYNQSLVASLIAHNGEQATEDWARAMVANMARDPVGGDRDQIKAVAAGECDLAVVNTYYLAMMASDDDPATRAVAESVAVFWPNQDERGVHINVSGAGLTAHAANRDNARQLLTFLTSDTAQQWYAERNHEYPAVEGIRVSEQLQGWGTFSQDDLNLSQLGELNADAVKVMDRAGWQ